MFSEISYKCLKVKTKLILSFVLEKYGVKNSRSIGFQALVNDPANHFYTTSI